MKILSSANKKLKELLDDPEFTKKYSEQLKKERDEVNQYYLSDEFNKDISSIKNHLKDNETIDTEDLKYNDELCNNLSLDQEKLWKVYDSIESNNRNLLKDTSSDFEATELIYDELVFSVISGQGSILIIRKNI